MVAFGEFRRSRMAGILGVLVVALAAFTWALWCCAPDPWPDRVRIGTASPGGAYSALGTGLAEILGDERGGTTWVARETAGSLENLRLLEEGEIDFAFVQSDTGGSDDIRMVAKLYDELLHVVVNRANFADPPQTIGDLNGKVLGIGSRGSGTRYAVSRLLKHYRVEFEDAYLKLEIPSAKVAIRAFEDGAIDGLFILSGLPDHNVERLVARPEAELIGVDDPAAADYTLPGYVRMTTGYEKADIFSGDYGRGIPARRLETVGVTALLVTHARMDEAVVREVTRILYDRKADLVHHHVAAQQIGEKTELRVQPYIDHPGAAAYYASEATAGPFREWPRYAALAVGGLALLAALAGLLHEWRRAWRRERMMRAHDQAEGRQGRHDVFIAYSTRSDEGVAPVREISEMLESHGLTCWYAPRNIAGGMRWAAAIPRAIESTRRAFVLVFCREANVSDHLAREVSLASSAELAIVPFFIEDVEPTGTISYHTAHVQRVFGLPGKRAEGLGRLLQAIQRLAARPRPGRTTISTSSFETPQEPAEPAEATASAPRRRKRLWIAAAGVIGLIALLAWQPWRSPPATAAPELHAPDAAALQVGGLLKYEWDFARHDRHVEYEIERWLPDEEHRLERVTARSWIENEKGLVGNVSWRVRALELAEDGSLKPTRWSSTRACTYYADTLQKILATGRVAVAMSADALSYWDAENQPTNIELELARLALQAALDLEGKHPRLVIDRVSLAWGKELFASLAGPEIDLITASLTIKGRRERDWNVRFTDPVVVFPPVLVHMPGQRNCLLPGSAVGVCRLGVKSQTTHEELAQRMARERPGITVIPCEIENAYLAMYDDLVKGELEFLLYDEPFAQRVQESAKLRHQELSLTPVDASIIRDPPLERIGIATKPFDDELRQLLNTAIEAKADEIEALKGSLRSRRVF